MDDERCGIKMAMDVGHFLQSTPKESIHFRHSQVLKSRVWTNSMLGVAHPIIICCKFNRVIIRTMLLFRVLVIIHPGVSCDVTFNLIPKQIGLPWADINRKCNILFPSDPPSIEYMARQKCILYSEEDCIEIHG